MSKELDLLNIDELIARESSFKKIMEDKIVTDEELSEQTKTVLDLIEEAEKRFKGDDLELIKRLFALRAL